VRGRFVSGDGATEYDGNWGNDQYHGAGMMAQRNAWKYTGALQIPDAALRACGPAGDTMQSCRQKLQGDFKGHSASPRWCPLLLKRGFIRMTDWHAAM